MERLGSILWALGYLNDGSELTQRGDKPRSRGRTTNPKLYCAAIEHCVSGRLGLGQRHSCELLQRLCVRNLAKANAPACDCYRDSTRERLIASQALEQRFVFDVEDFGARLAWPDCID